MYTYPDYLEHHGILGMRWGIRRYVNKDGSLTSQGKTHVSNYKKSKLNKKRVSNEVNKIVSSNKSKFKSYDLDNVDDPSYIEFQASDKGISTKALRKSMVNASDFYNKNSESIELGRKIVSKTTKGNADYTRPINISGTGSYDRYMRTGK